MQLGAPDVAMIGYRFWKSNYGGDSSVLGRPLRFKDRSEAADQTVTIVGVLPESYWRDAKIVLPLRQSGEYLEVVGRLRPDVILEEAQRRLIASAQGPVGPVRLFSLLEESSLERNPQQLYLLSGAAVLVLLLACGNVAGLALASGFTRSSELAVRASLGASRLRLIRQILTESCTLAAIGGVAGLILASALLNPLVASFAGLIGQNARATLNVSVRGAATGFVLLTGIVTGLLPSLRMSSGHLNLIQSAGSRFQHGALSRRSGQFLLVLNWRSH